MLLQIDRKLAPFWRGLQDSPSASWTDAQVIAAARDLPISPADQTPPENVVPGFLSADSPTASTQNLSGLTVPTGGGTLSAASDKNASHAGSALPSPTTIVSARGSSPFKPRAKVLAAALSTASRHSSTEIVPHETSLPQDPFFNGRPIEVFLYKDALECPICFLSYPPFLNHTRCCDQPICSECFVQIKRPDPHYPEGHGENPDNPNVNPEEQAGQLISEPACCPYCQQPEFGVTYDPPPFRRGLAYSASLSSTTVAATGTAMSSSSSLNSTLSPSSAASPSAFPPSLAHPSRRRTQSLSANAPNVITTDRIRPDWSTKLATQRAHIARRAAAATALHTAAFLMGSSESRTFRVGRFGRRNTGPGVGNDSDNSPIHGNSDGGEGSPPSMEAGARGSSSRALLTGNNRRSRMEDLEELMFREALRQSLATEEERRRKTEKEERKEAKRREKEERKAAKAASKRPYNASTQSSASGSSVSLSGLGLGRRRGNSGASNLRVEASLANAAAAGGNASSSASPVAANGGDNKGKGVDRGPSLPEAGDSESYGTGPASSAPRPISTPHQSSHLRQMSSASSVSSSPPDSPVDSYPNPSLLQDPRASGLSLGSRSAASEDGGEHADDPSTSSEPLFNFRSLAEMVGVQLDGENAGRRLSAIGRDVSVAGAQEDSQQSAGGKPSEPAEKPGVPDEGTQEEATSASTITPPKVMVTPETPAATDDDGGQHGTNKQLGFETTVIEHTDQITQ